jgi:hypothetical protein
MKKIYNTGFLILITFVALTFQSCDILENFFLNLPLKQPITSTGNGPTISETENICLADYEAYEDNIDDIQSVEYLSALYRTLDTPQLTPGLTGTEITVELRDGNNNLLFTKNLPTAVADDYIDTPYELELTAGEIALLNGYLELYKDPDLWNTVCFMATLTVENVSGNTGPPYTLTGQVELLLELELAP